MKYLLFNPISPFVPFSNRNNFLEYIFSLSPEESQIKLAGETEDALVLAQGVIDDQKTY